MHITHFFVVLQLVSRITAVPFHINLLDPISSTHKPPDSRTTGNYSDSNTGSLESSYFSHDFLEISNHPFEKSRAVRSEQHSDEYSKRVTSLARLYNAISLQSELMNGTKTPEDAVLQLLSIESVKVSDILEFTPDPIIALIDEMEKARGKIGFNTIQKEEMVLADSLIKSYSSIGSFTEARSVDEYENTISDFLSKIKVSSTSVFIQILSDTMNYLEGINHLKSDSDPSTKNAAIRSLARFKHQIPYLKLELDAFEKEVPVWKKFLFLGDVDSLKTLKPIKEMIRIFKFREYLLVKKRFEGKATIDTEFLEISQLVKPSKIAEKTLSVMRSLVRSKAPLGGTLGGVSGLKLLANSLQEAWVKKALPHGEAHQIVRGLQPIISMSSKLEHIEDLVDRVTQPGFLKSFRALEELQKLILALNTGFEDSSNFFTSYTSCLENNKISPGHYSRLEDLMVEASKLHINLRTLRRSGFLERDMRNIYEELEKMAKSITFSNPQDNPRSQKEVFGIYEKVMADGSLPKVKKLLSAIVRSLEGFDTEIVHNTAKKIVNITSVFDKYWTDNAATLRMEDSVSECMKSLDISDQASTAAKVVIGLRDYDHLNHMKGVKTRLNFFSEISKGLKDLNIGSIVDIMKNKSTNETSKVNKMTPYLSEGLTGTEIIKKAAVMLHDSYEFVKFKSRISQLDVDIEVDKLTLLNPITLKSIEEQWGNQEQFMDQLVKDISVVELFHSSISLANITTFEDYGAPLKKISFGKIGDGLEQKSNALVMSLPFYYNKTEGMKLEKVKKMMDEMAALELDFADHKAKFDGAQEVLEHFHTFLKQQFPDEIGDDEPVQTQGDDEDDLRNAKIIIFICTGLIVSLVVAITLSSVIYKRCIAKKKEKTDLRRSDLQCNTKNLMATRGYHGNEFVTRTGTILSGMNILATVEDVPDDSQESFWDIGWNDVVEFTVMLNKTNDGLYDDNSQLRMIIPRYFPAAELGGIGRSITIGKYTLTEIISTNRNNEDMNANRDFTKRVFEIKRTTGKLFSKKTEIRRVTHYSCLDWEDDGIPRSGFQSIYEVMTIVKQSQKPIVVHCDTGTNRTMSFIGMEYISRMIEVDTRLTYQYAFTMLAEHRLRSFDTLRNSYTLQMGVFYFMLMKIEQTATFDTHRRMYKNVVLNRKRVPSDEICITF